MMEEQGWAGAAGSQGEGGGKGNMIMIMTMEDMAVKEVLGKGKVRQEQDGKRGMSMRSSRRRRGVLGRKRRRLAFRRIFCAGGFWK